MSAGKMIDPLGIGEKLGKKNKLLKALGPMGAAGILMKDEKKKKRPEATGTLPMSTPTTNTDSLLGGGR